jgi:cytoskeleton protein RodZ
MSEALVHDGMSVPAGAIEGATAGAMLRAAREAAGLHVAAMAVALKVPVGKLEALEQDRYDLLPDAVFARALASTVCRTLKIDPRPVLARLPRTSAPRLIQDTDGINAPFRSPRDQVAATWRDHLTKPVSLAVGALLLGAVLVTLWPHGPVGDGAASGKAEGPMAAATQPPSAAAPLATGEPATADSASAVPLPEQRSASPLVPASITVPTAAASRPAAAPVTPAPAPVAAAAPMTAAPAPSAAAAAAEAGPNAVVFRASAQSWIEVRDAKGAVPIRKVLAAGESATVSGAMPMQVTIGNVNATELDVRGKRFDLKSVARDNVARFQIK